MSDKIDQAILAHCRTQWLKVARVIGDVAVALNLPGETVDQFIADRIVGLVEAGKLESQGNLAKWRFSEVRLPQQ